MVGDDIPLGTKASMMIVTEPVQPLVKPVVSVLGRSLSFKQTDRGALLIGGGLQGRADLDGQRAHVDMAVLVAGARAAVEIFPAARGVRVARAWAGLEAKTADLLPVIGPSPNAPPGVFVFGFGARFQLVRGRRGRGRACHAGRHEPARSPLAAQRRGAEGGGMIRYVALSRSAIPDAARHASR